MATNPVRKIQASSFDSPLDINTIEPLHFLASLTPSLDIPYLTMTIDWTPAGGSPGREAPPELLRSELHSSLRHEEGASRRPGKTEIRKKLTELLDTLEPRSDRHVKLQADIESLDVWLDRELDPASQGVYIVSGPDLLLPLALAVPVETSLWYEPFPVLQPLAHIAEDYATYAVLAADQENAELSYLTQGVRSATVRLQSNLYPRHQQTGGPSQRRYQNRAGERTSHFARSIVEQVENALTEWDVPVIVPVGSHTFLAEIRNVAPESVASRLTETVPLHLNPWPSMHDLAEATSAVDLAAERGREAAAVAEVRELMGQNQAVAGTVDVLNALQAHQVRQLVMNEDFSETGWADLTLPLYGVGEVPTEHPTGGDVANLVPMDLAEAMIRLTLQSDGTIELVHTQVPMDSTEGVKVKGSDIPRSEAAAQLDEVGGVGAVLRYTT